MRFGLTEEQYQFILRNIITPLENLNANVWCYGSRARGDFHPFSDLDLMVEQDFGQKSEIKAQISKIREFMENSNFPIKTDLTEFAEFASSYLKGYQKDKILFRQPNHTGPE